MVCAFTQYCLCKKDVPHQLPIYSYTLRSLLHSFHYYCIHQIHCEISLTNQLYTKFMYHNITCQAPSPSSIIEFMIRLLHHCAVKFRQSV